MSQNIFLLQGFLPMGSVRLGRLLADIDNPHEYMHGPDIKIKTDSDTVISSYLNYAGN
jgi:hypothetical protein